MREKIRSKLADRTGFTLAELMISMLVMLMVTGIVASGIPLAKDAMDKVVDAANARLLLSTTATALRTELSVAADVKIVDTNVITYTSAESGSQSRIFNVDGASITLQEYADYTVESRPELDKVPDNPDGGKPRPKPVNRQLVSDSAATKGLTTQFAGVSYNQNTHCLTITELKVMKEGQTTPLAVLGEYQIRNIAP